MRAGAWITATATPWRVTLAPQMPDLMHVPPDLPVPLDDGLASHLGGRKLPSVDLPSTMGGTVDPSRHESAWLVLFVYPMTGRPDLELPEGWNEIPGARGCTPQASAFNDHGAALTALGARTFGLSVQDSAYQREMADRLDLSYGVLSDHARQFGDALALPTFAVAMPGGEEIALYKRLTLIARRGVIEHVMYPVFPSHENAVEVEAWLRAQQAARSASPTPEENGMAS